VIARRLLIGEERLAQGEVEVHDARTRFERRPVRAAREVAHPAARALVGFVEADLEEPLGRAPEQLELVDRLPGAVLA
jgi:hypothetical protein